MQLNFDPRSVDIGADIDKLPAGEYPFVITSTEHVMEKKALFLKFTVQPGHPSAGMSHNFRLGLWSENTDEYRIAWETLAKICLVLGIPLLNDTRELQGKPFIGILTPNKKNEKYTDVKFKTVNGLTPHEVQAGKAPAATVPSFAPAAPVPPPQAPAIPVPVPNQQWGGPAQPPAQQFAPAQPQVGWPGQQQQAPAPTPAPWGAPPATNGAPPAWSK